MGPNFRNEIIKMILNKWAWLGVGGGSIRMAQGINNDGTL